MRRLLAGQEIGVHTWTGEGEPPVLALHGFTGSGLDFESLAMGLGRSVVAPDLLGHGESACPAEVEAYRMSAEVERLRELVGERKHVVLGYSMGARVGLALALEAPACVEALVLVGGRPGLVETQERLARRQEDEVLAAHLEAVGVENFYESWASRPLMSTQSRIDGPVRSRMLDRRLSSSASGWAGSLRGMGTGAMESLWDHLSGLASPVLLVTGEEDFRFEAIARDMASQLPRGECVSIPAAGHCAHLEAPAATLSAIQAFLSAQGLA